MDGQLLAFLDSDSALACVQKLDDDVSSAPSHRMVTVVMRERKRRGNLVQRTAAMEQPGRVNLNCRRKRVMKRHRPARMSYCYAVLLLRR